MSTEIGNSADIGMVEVKLLNRFSYLNLILKERQPNGNGLVY